LLAGMLTRSRRLHQLLLMLGRAAQKRPESETP
jgi:hypothetical protein